MSKVLENVKKRLTSEVFKSDDGVSEVPDPAFMKGPHDTDLKKYQEGEGKSKEDKNKKITTKDGKQYPMPKLKKVSEEDGDEEEDYDDEDDDKKEKDEDENEDQDDDDDDDDEEKKEWFDVRVSRDSIDLSEDLKALFGSDKDLSEEFKERTRNIFEAAVISNTNSALDEALEHLAEQYEKEKEIFYEHIVDKVNQYLNVIVEKWLEDNEEELVSNARVEVAESFLEGLKQLYTEHYIDIPDEKIDVVEDLAEKIDEQDEMINDIYSKLAVAINENKELRKFLIISEESKDLTDLQLEKLLKLSEGIDFNDDDDFVEKVREIKEAYFDEDDDGFHTRSFDNDANDPLMITEDYEHNNNKDVDDEVKFIAEEISRRFSKK